jgi:hypothetical protein
MRGVLCRQSIMQIHPQTVSSPHHPETRPCRGKCDASREDLGALGKNWFTRKGHYGPADITSRSACGVGRKVRTQNGGTKQNF